MGVSFKTKSIVLAALAGSIIAFGGYNAVNNSSALANNPIASHQHEQQFTRFAVMGDTGSGAPQQFDVANQLNNAYNKKPFEAVLVLGDIIYPNGDVDKLGESRFKQPYKYLLQDKHIPFIIALGNHDLVLGDVNKQLSFYKMPSRYYKKTLGKTLPVDIFVLDTNAFANDKEQIFWLDKTLRESTAPWKIVIGHHPPFTSGLHGNNEALQQTLVPLLIRNQVPLYLAGHDHHYERFRIMQGVTYLISGGGGAYLRPVLKKSSENSVVRQKVFHFLTVDASPTQLNIKAINREGQQFDQVTIKRPYSSPIQQLKDTVYGAKKKPAAKH